MDADRTKFHLFAMLFETTCAQCLLMEAGLDKLQNNKIKKIMSPSGYVTHSLRGGGHKNMKKPKTANNNINNSG